MEKLTDLLISVLSSKLKPVTYTKLNKIHESNKSSLVRQIETTHCWTMGTNDVK